MKKTLKEWQSALALKKKELRDARKAKKAAKETDPLIKWIEAVEEALAIAADQGAIKETDEIEIKFPEEEEDTKSIDLKELQELIGNELETRIKVLLKDQAQKDQVTKDSIKESIAKAFEARDEKVDKSDIKTFVGEVVEEQLARIKKKKKMVHETEDANPPEEGDDDEDSDAGTKITEADGKKFMQVEIPDTLCKGNLPLHYKQLLNIMMRQPMNQGIPGSMIRRGEILGKAMLERYRRMARNGQKAMTSTGAGVGDEWVPTDMSSELNRRLYLSSNIAAMMLAKEIDMPSNPYELPLVTTRPRFYLHTTENTNATKSDIGTAKTVLTAATLKAEVDYSYELDEDSIIPILPLVNDLLGEAAADNYEDIIMNGDTTATHMDSDTELVANDANRAWKGLRKLSLAVAALKVDWSTGGVNEANCRAIRKSMGKYGISNTGLVWLVGPAGYAAMTAISNVTTVEKYGPKATILSGELSSFLGIPIIVSERVRENLNASGVYDGITTTKGSLTLVNLGGFWAGRRREFTIEVDRDIRASTHFLVASFRRAFQPQETPSAAFPVVATAYNWTA